MAGAYCKFCSTRCFVSRVIPGGPLRGRSFHLATCQPGMAHDLKMTGYTHESAVNPVLDPEGARACLVPDTTTDPVDGEGSDLD
jgi:hypothetical protein